jgi:hypothetical protein
MTTDGGLMSEQPLFVAQDHPENKDLMTQLAAYPTGFPLISSHAATWKDPYTHHGSPPQIVSWIWKELAKALPTESRCFIYSAPALVAPKSGMILAAAIGTGYVLRVPPAAAREAIAATSLMVRALVAKGGIDVSSSWRGSWVYGTFSNEERVWCRAVYDEFETFNNFH